jgi:hypothetical protein
MEWISASSALKSDFLNPLCTDWNQIYHTAFPPSQNIKVANYNINNYQRLISKDKLLQFLAKHPYHGRLIVDNSSNVILLHSIRCKTETNSIYALSNKSLNSSASSTLISESSCSISWYRSDDLKTGLQSIVLDVGTYSDDIQKIKSQFPSSSQLYQFRLR